MNSLAFSRCSSPLTPASISGPASLPVPSLRIKIRRPRRTAAVLRIAAQKHPRIVAMATAAPASSAKEVLPAPLTAASEPPPLFDGTTRLYVAYHCPYAQRAWITRNYKVPALEHNNQVKGESLDLVKYIDSNFEGPSLLPDDAAKKQFAEELLAYTDEFNKAAYSSIVCKEDASTETVAALDKIEAALGKFSDGPFFLGQFSLVPDFFSNLKNYDITAGRPNLQKFIEEVNKIDAYTQTKQDPQFLLEHTKKRLGVPSLEHNNKIIGESLDLIKYMDNHFEGPKLTSDDPEKQRLAEELLGYSDTFNRAMVAALISKGVVTAEAVDALDKIDRSLSKFDDGPFFLGKLSLVDIAYVPFIDGFQIFFTNIKNYDITRGRVNIRRFIEEMNMIDAFTQTKQDPQVLLALTKKQLGV
ncbi:hypothetical protein PR202_gb19456 [Eleusine coracana subsp. coracana]|uniref:GST N-terminal domain-containing protein n=1 Tax=Eleusine coracana subsp. coracana TaxID=191504 RepID=A0AAV5F8B2_ELECO|nr:hypothetical protein PR202_gb19456 [Eleusine coracana subsp. coracana]